MTTILGLGELGTIDHPRDELKTYALGSCIGVVLIDRKSRVVGMAHVVMPDSSIDPERAARQPGRFADTAIPALIDAVRKKGGGGKLVAKLTGGALISKANESYQIGKRNALAIKKLLWKHRIPALAEEVGGNISRTISVRISGTVKVQTPGMEDRVL